MALRLLVLLGPTACGKTRLAVEVAHALGSEIISADSRQVYRGLDIGTGKDLADYRAVEPPVRCHLIDVADPREIYTVFRYQHDVYALLAQLHSTAPWSAGTPLLLVGGTGMYAESILGDYRIANVPVDSAFRQQLMGEDLTTLVARLSDEAPELVERTDLESKKRVVRALEIAAYGRTAAVRYSGPCPVEIESTVYCIDVPRDELDRRIEARLQARIAQGLIEEVERLLDAGVSAERLRQLGLEYREVTQYLTGAKTEAVMIADLAREIRRFARRQLTWFRGLPRRGIDVTWIGPDEAEPLLTHHWP